MTVLIETVPLGCLLVDVEVDPHPRVGNLQNLESLSIWDCGPGTQEVR